jgi:hypothetical protein
MRFTIALQVITDFETKVLLLELLVAIQKRQVEDIKSKKEIKMVGEHCETTLKTKWVGERYKVVLLRFDTKP